MVRQLLLLVAVGSSGFAQCSLDTVRGTWAYQVQGTFMMPGSGNTAPAAVPFAGQGVQRIDYQGRFTVAGTINTAGQVQSVRVTGSLSVNPDCTANDVYTIPGVPGLRSDRLVILDGGNEMEMMATNLGSTGIAHYRRLSWSEPSCTTNMVHGVYAGTWNGTIFTPGPGGSSPVSAAFAQIGTATFDYAGTGSGATTISIGGSVLLEYAYPVMKLSVNPDCTGSVKYTATAKGSTQVGSGGSELVILNNGDEVLMLSTSTPDAPGVIVGRLKRTSML